ncbi:MAG: hypothetical protein Q7K48_09155 [Fusobacterium sp. JB021]|nr:hypothetical protein [Fusobacterium sp. JB020]MDP0494451.1 hypothetical protein [Fusobacterium sp. JB021]MDP0506804.1 hypothetical protein [Fusobacterium sp. JB019]
MKKVVFFLGLVFLFISCSNNQIKVADEDINIFFKHIKTNIKKNNISAIESDFKKSIYNRKTIEELKKYNFENIKIVFSKAEIQGNNARNIIGLIFSEEVIYLHGEYKLTKGKWKIERVENGRKGIEKK